MMKSLCCLAVLGLWLLQDGDREESANNLSAQQERYGAAHEVWDHLTRKGRPQPEDPETAYRWSRRLAESSIAAGVASEVDAYRDHLARMEDIAGMATTLHKIGRSSVVDLAVQRYYVTEAKVWLQQAEASK